MSDQSFASPVDPYWLSSRGVKSVHFLKQDSPPLAYADGRGALYELNDGVLYFNGVPISGGGGSGDVSSSTDPSINNALARFDGTTGKIIQEGNIILEDGSGDNVVLSGKPGGSTLPMILCTDTTQKTTLGLRTPQDSSLGIGSTAIGSSAMEGSTAAQYSTAVGANSGFDCDGDSNSFFGYNAGINYTGTESNNICIDSPGTLGDNNTIRIGDTQTKCFLKGVYQAAGIGASEMVIVDAAGQLSSTTAPSAGLTYGALRTAGEFILYDSPTTVSSTTLSYNNAGGNNPEFIISSAPTSPIIKMVANHSVYAGGSCGGNYAASSNTVYGGGAMGAHSAGGGNTAIGNFALAQKTTGSSCVAVGSSSLQNLLTGTGNVALGNSAGTNYTGAESNNICILNDGVIADSGSIRIGNNTQDKCFIAREFKSNGTTLRIGNQAGLALLDTNTTSGCTLVGNQTGINSASITNTTAVGSLAARYSTGNSNTVVGSGSLSGLSATGNNNAILGWNCAASTTSAQGNVIVGTNGAIALTSGSTNTLVGNSVAQNLTTGSSNICIAGAGGGGGTLSTGSNNILIGANAPLAATATSIIIGSATQTSTSIAEDFRSNNTITRVGYRAGNVATTSATATVLVGSSAGLAITSATGNTLVGSGAGAGLTGAVNTVVGAQSLDNAGAQANNTVVGATTARSCTSNDNVILGHIAAQQLTTSPNNIIIGKGSGQTLATGTGGGIYIAANAASATEAGTIRIGTAATQTRAFISGISGVTTGGAAVAVLVDANGQLGTVSSSRLVKENIRPIESTDWLHQLELVNFEYINGTADEITGLKQKQVGVIAENVELIKPELVIMQGNGIKTVDYNALYVCALKELQKLRIDYDALAARVAALEIAP